MNTPEQSSKQVTFQETPVTTASAQQCLAMLDRYESLLADGPKLATPGNPNPEKAVQDLGGIIAGFLFTNARALLQNHQICQTEYVPLVRGIHAALLRGPFAQAVAQAVVAGFAEVGAKRQAEAQAAQKEAKP